MSETTTKATHTALSVGAERPPVAWLASREEFERENPAPPLRPIVCCVCGETESRYSYKRDGKDICGICLDAPVALAYVRMQSVMPHGN